jgi:hypothetical protein
MQDQMRFEDDKGEWYTPSPEIPSNHRGTYKNHGEWAEPIFPSNISLAGSPATPYIFDDRCSPEDAAKSLVNVFTLGTEERDRRGLVGREWAMSDEAGFTSDKMCESVSTILDNTLDRFIPRQSFEIFKAKSRPSRYIEHNLLNY